MGYGEKKFYDKKDDQNSTPKLHLYNTFPSKMKEPIGMVTPPLHSFASIPFEWEEAPGKPRATGTTTTNERSKSKTVRCLVPPPRLMSGCNHSSKITSMPSPTTVLDGPNAGGDSSLSLSKSFSLSSRRSFRSGHEGEERSVERFRFTYWRKGGGGRGSNEKHGNGSGGVEGDMDFSYAVDRKLKRGIRRRSSSFLSLSRSNLWSSIYGSLKQAVPWKRVPEKPTNSTTTTS